MQKILVWDWPVRIGHWLMVGGFILSWLTGDSETYRLVHVYAGATVLAVATFRLPWGFIGSRYARFVDFIRGPGGTSRRAQSGRRLGHCAAARPRHPDQPGRLDDV
jgi:cytochrome b